MFLYHYWSVHVILCYIITGLYMLSVHVKDVDICKQLKMFISSEQVHYLIYSQNSIPGSVFRTKLENSFILVLTSTPSRRNISSPNYFSCQSFYISSPNYLKSCLDTVSDIVKSAGLRTCRRRGRTTIPGFT